MMLGSEDEELLEAARAFLAGIGLGVHARSDSRHVASARRAQDAEHTRAAEVAASDLRAMLGTSPAKPVRRRAIEPRAPARIGREHWLSGDVDLVRALCWRAMLFSESPASTMSCGATGSANATSALPNGSVQTPKTHKTVLALSSIRPYAPQRVVKTRARNAEAADAAWRAAEARVARSYRHLLGASSASFSESSSERETTPSMAPDMDGDLSADMAAELSAELSDAASDAQSDARSRDSTVHTRSEATTEGTTSSWAIDADAFENALLRSGKHRTLVVLPGYVASISHHGRAALLKDELNARFRLAQPDVHATLTLSKVRRAEAMLLAVARARDVEAAALARALYFFEKLVLSGLVGKANRRVVAACCLLLATKATDTRDTDFGALFAAMASELGVDVQTVAAAEFAVFAALSFRLQVPPAHIERHMSRVLDMLDCANLQEYLGTRAYELYSSVL